MTTLILFSERPLLHALGWSLLHFCWQGTVIATLLASVLGLLRGRSPRLRYAASCCGLALMVVLPLVTFSRLANAPQAGIAPVTTANIDRGPVLSPGSVFGTTEPWLDQIATKLDHSLPWVLSVWFAGVILLLSRLNLGLIGARRMKSSATQPAPAELQWLLQRLRRRLGVERAIGLAHSALVQVPTVVGWLRPVILIPVGCLMGLSTGQVEAVLAHELAHIRRHDYLVSIFQSVVETLLFYQPAVWWVSNQVRREREHCCDDFAVRISGDSLAYAKALSFLEERRASVPVVALGANGGVLAMRIKRLLGCKEAPADSRFLVITFWAVVLVVAGLGIGTAARAASPQTTAESSQDLPPKYQQWLNEDVVWVITPEERAAFSQLKSDEERDKFMQMFWLRRSPTPNSPGNKVKDEHYRRVAYANAHFMTTSTPGWKTDRGRIYIIYGPPDEIESHPAHDSAGSIEAWRYHSIRENAPTQKVVVQGKEGLRWQMVTRKNVVMTFVDVSGRGDYQLQPPAKN